MMRNLRLYIVLLALISIFNTMYGQSNKKEVLIESADEIKLTGDLYLTDDDQAPFLIMFHQAGYSRGEYTETAKKFNALGYSCLAIDARSGKSVNGIENSAFKQAQAKGLGTKYQDAMPDLKAAIDFVKNNYRKSDIYLIGSSYSASLSIVLASEIVGLSGVVAFSPGEYFKFNGKKIADYARKALCPVFITSAKGEVGHWVSIYSALPEALAYSHKPNVKGVHGSRALWSTTEGSDIYWEAVMKFLD